MIDLVFNGLACSDVELRSREPPRKESMFKGKMVIVFGGSGSIGSLIVEQLLKEGVETVRVFSNDENSNWKCQQKWGNEKVRYILGDIRNLESVKRAMNECDYVFNCAAIKHVPFAEYNPIEAINVNVIGFDNIITACIEKKIKKLLHISTDKAVKSSTVMGASKFISERLLQIRWSQNPNIKMVCVRLGNVWGSRGSIALIIKKCIKQKKPIPITDLNMKRYIMQSNEVIEFIMESFREGGNGEIFIPKLKEFKLIDVIFKDIQKDYPYDVIGLRKGEKLKEEMISKEELKNAEEYDNKWIIKNAIRYDQ